MKLTVLASEDGITRVHSAEDVTIVDVQGANPLEQLLGPDGFKRKVLLSLAASPFIDSAGVGWLIMTHKKFKDAGGMLVVHSLSPMVNHVFRLLQVGTVLPVADDEAKALQLAGAPAPRG